MPDYNLQQELQTLKTQWKDHQDELHLLYAVAKELAFTRDLDLLLDRIVERAAHVLDAEAASLLLLNPDTFKLDFTVVKGRHSEVLRNLDIHLTLGEGVTGWVAAEKKAAIVNRAAQDPRFKGEVDRRTGFVTRNLLAVPLVAQGKMIGVLEVINRLGDRDFTEDNAEFLGAVGWLVAMALDNAQTYRALEVSEEYLADILESLPGGFIGVDMQQRVTHCNARALEILGLPATVIGQRYTQALAAQAGAVRSIESAFAESQGLKRQVFTSSTPWKGHRQVGYSTLTIRSRRGGVVQGVGLLFQDITEFVASGV